MQKNAPKKLLDTAFKTDKMVAGILNQKKSDLVKLLDMALEEAVRQGKFFCSNRHEDCPLGEEYSSVYCDYNIEKQKHCLLLKLKERLEKQQ